MGEEVEFKPEGVLTEQQEQGKRVIIEAAGIERGMPMLVTCKVVGFTVESKAGEYNALRGYGQFEPENLYIHVLIHDPDKKVDGMDDAGIFGAVFNHIATELDMNVVDVAGRRVDREIVKKDQERKVKTSRFDAGERSVPAKESTVVI